MKDKLGNELKLGSYIVYAGRRGSSLWLTIGKVLYAEEDSATVIGIDNYSGVLKSRVGKLTNSGTIAIIHDSLVSEELKSILDM